MAQNPRSTISSRYKTFGELLKYLRRRARLTQRDLAVATGYSIAQICRLEQNQRLPDSISIAALFLPALDLKDAPELAAHLLDLAQAARLHASTPPMAPATLVGLHQRTARGTLPVSSSPLIGRKQEISSVSAFLLDPHIRLLTLTGPPGVGKTRLALAVAEATCDAFADGTFFVSLAPIRSPELVATSITHALALEERGETPDELLKAYLHDRCLLLVLDNFEHLLPAAPLVAELLATSSKLKVLATSRATLHISAEHEYQVPPLALPTLNSLSPVEVDEHAFAQSPAVKLFLQRARAVKPDLRLTPANARTIAEICVRLDGLPLAIELAATRVKLLPPQALLARLDHRLRVLTAGRQDLPPRQQTLRSTLDWSYMLLDEEEKLLFRRLSVFAGGCRLDTIEAICNADGRVSMGVLDAVASLLDKSLLQQDPLVEQEPRFVMLETMREYASEQLAVSGEDEEICRRHALVFLQLAEKADLHLRGAAQRAWFAWLDREHDNLRAAIAWATEHEETLINLRLAAAVAWNWQIRGYISEGQQTVETALARAASQLSTATPQEAHAGVWAFFGASLLAFRQGNRAHVVFCLEQAVNFGRQWGDLLGTSYATALLAVTRRFEEQHGEVLALAEESIAVFRQSDDRWGLAWSVFCLGEVMIAREEYLQARAYYAESLLLWQEVGDRHAAAMVIGNLGQLAARLGDYAAARTQLQEALGVHCEFGDRWFIATWLYRLAEVEWRAGDFARAARLFGAANVPLDTIGSNLGHWEQVEQERELAAIRAHLDEITFTTLWREGRSLSLDQTIVYALNIAATDVP